MRLFWEFCLRSIQRQFAYRAATFAGLLTNFFFGLLRLSVLVALYGARDQVAGITVQGAVTFTGLSQAVIGVMSLFGWYELMNSIYTGAVGTDLLKPMGYYRYWLAQDAGRAIGQFLLRGLPMMFAYALFFHISFPASPEQWLGLVMALCLGWLVSFSYRFLINLTSFWVPNALGIGRFAFLLVFFLSGFFMPMRFFPSWFVTFCSYTPFPYMVSTIIEVYLGLVTGLNLVRALALQAVWALGLALLCQVVLRLGIRRLVILGG